jgi:hypothetical protein
VHSNFNIDWCFFHCILSPDSVLFLFHFLYIYIHLFLSQIYLVISLYSMYFPLFSFLSFFSIAIYVSVVFTFHSEEIKLDRVHNTHVHIYTYIQKNRKAHANTFINLFLFSDSFLLSENIFVFEKNNDRF